MDVVLFDFYLDWYKDFFTVTELTAYESNLRALRSQLKSHLAGRTSVHVNGLDEDELKPKPKLPAGEDAFPIAALWYLLAFALLFAAVTLVGTLSNFGAKSMVVVLAVTTVVFFGITALTASRGFKVLDRIARLKLPFGR